MGKIADFVVGGGGIIGMSIARELRRRLGASVLVVEKEDTTARHGSGRNSGVLHAGFYYTADTLKARFTVEGNRRLHEFIEERGIPINKCGKLVVAQTEADLKGLDILLERGRVNGVQLESISEKEAKQIEPKVKTVERAIFSPHTSSANPIQVTEAVERAAVEEGVEVWKNAKVVSATPLADGSGCEVVAEVGGKDEAERRREQISSGHFINACGLHADTIAHSMGFGMKYAIVPFKGIYLYSDPALHLHCHVYPVPNLANPFLGVHFTVTSAGEVKIGPSAIPSFWREQYGGVEGFDMGEMWDVCKRNLSLLFNANFQFATLAREELKKYNKNYFLSHASSLVDGMQQYSAEKWRWGKPGIRAQLVNVEKRTLEMDFIVEGDHTSTHVLNAVSPGWTCSFPFADYVVDRVEKSVR
uniref:L-2-hydroxyglutarate dehydrogenase, mitochondrial n=1 Tax=Palpitomonas bilix TaxID=652834 RepID=A0A7S3GBQ2_9EUKA